MAQSSGMLRRTSSFVLCVLLLGALTGCDIADRLRPDLNFDSEVHVFPNEGGIVDGDVQPGPNAGVWPAGSPNNGGFSYTSPDRNVLSENFVGTPADMIGADDYGTYLEEQVYKPIVKLIEGLGEDKASKIYFSCGHTGYDMVNGRFVPRSGWSDETSGRAVNAARAVGGMTLVKLAEDWLGPLDKNEANQATQVKQAQSTINAYASAEDMTKSWYELANSTFPKEYYRMFGRDGANFATLQDYYDAIATDPYRNIPSYSFYYYTGDTTTDRIIFNDVPANMTTPYQPGVALTTVKKMFRTYNQYITRDREISDVTTTDDDSILHYYLDGYNKTVMFIGTTSGSNLKDVIGDDDIYEEIYNIIHDAYTCIKCDEITSIKPEPAPTPSPNPSESADPSASPEPSSTPEPTGPDYSGFRVIPAGTKGAE